MKSDFFSNNRKTLSGNGKLVVLTAHDSMQRRSDMAYNFEQEANFFYLTGILAGGWWIIIDGIRGKSVLVAPELSEAHRIFEGGLSDEEAIRISGADEVIARDEADKYLRDLAGKHSVVHALGKDPHAQYYEFVSNPAVKALWSKLDRIFDSVQDCRQDLAKQRAIKQPEELKRMRKAITLTTETFKDVQYKLSTMRHEYEVEAAFTHGFRYKNAQHAYDPIVASGMNACTLHYTANANRLGKNDLLLIDIGAAVDGYAADITRTYAVGKLSARQRDIHQAVRQAHSNIISLLKPGLLVEEYQHEVDVIMSRSLMELGLIKSKDDDAYHRYFPHAVSHGLGIDVHDSLGAPRMFEEGMVLTVEPGIYVNKESIGVRIEDDILITASGHQNLSASLSTEP